jgi:RHS repeat-associated protein
MRFAGHWRDFLGLLNVENTEYLDYMHARYYDPNIGRFLSVDPEFDLEKMLGNPQMWNRYTYVMNNPLRYVDPTGRASKEKKEKELAQAAKDALKDAGAGADPLEVANLMIKKIGDFRASGPDILKALKEAGVYLPPNGWAMLAKVHSINVETKAGVRNVTINATPFTIPLPRIPDLHVGKTVQAKLESTPTKLVVKDISGLSMTGGIRLTGITAETVKMTGGKEGIKPRVDGTILGLGWHKTLDPFPIP